MNSTSPSGLYKWLSAILAVAIIGLVAWTQPWAMASKSRTISVTGTGTVSGVPDEYDFSISYQKQASTAQAANSQVSAIGNEVVGKLKGLGLTDKQIKTTLSTNGAYPLNANGTSDSTTAVYQITIKAQGKDQAQKVQDYLATTPVQYGYTPYTTFSQDEQNKLQDQARQAALADAKKKADKTAQELGVKVGKVVTVADVTTPGGPINYATTAAGSALKTQDTASPIVEGGSQDVSLSVTVTYQIR